MPIFGICPSASSKGMADRSGPKPVLRIDSKSPLQVEPPSSGQHHPELNEHTALLASQRGKVHQVLAAAENTAGAFS